MDDPIHVLITLPFDERMVEKLNLVSPRIKISVIPTNKVEDIPAEQWQKTEVIYTNRVLPASGMAPRLKWVQFHWAGIDHVADLPLLKSSEITTTTLSGAACSQVAEYILMMILSLGHRLPDMYSAQRRVEWPRDRWERFSPRELRESTVGIVGYGSIGRQAARLLHAYGAKVLATKRNAMKPEDPDYMVDGMGDPAGDFVHRLYPAQAVRSMLKECDFIVVATPLTPDTQGMINADVLHACKPNAYLVDVSRGGVVDHEALASALKAGKLAGAALDVFPIEPLPPESPLWKLPNVLITPHISGITPFYDERAIDLFAENLRRYIIGLPLYNRFDPEEGY